jgi:ELWxxDGT repeat protein
MRSHDKRARMLLLLGLVLVLAAGPGMVTSGQTIPPYTAAFLVKDINQGAPRELIDFNGTLYFATDAGLWKSDGTIAGTQQLLQEPYVEQLVLFAGSLYFFTLDGQLWRSDGTVSGTVALIETNGRGSKQMVASDHQLFFHLGPCAPGQLWRSDGTTVGTFLLKEFPTSRCRTDYVNGLTPMGDDLFFAFGSELWKSDGTPSGTTLVANMSIDDYRYIIYNLSKVNSTLFFSAFSDMLWKSDGTAEGTVPVKQFTGFAPFFHGLRDINGTLMFGVGIGIDDNQLELWKSDGTATGTTRVKEFDASFLTWSMENDGWLFATISQERNYGTELWKSDGTEAGTMLVRDINPGEAHSGPRGLTTANGKVLFMADDGIHGFEFWLSDGTAGGTILMQDINLGAASSYPSEFTVSGDLVFFSADDGIHGAELWAIPVSALSNQFYLPLVNP